MKALLISKPLLIPMVALIVTAIALTAATAAILGDQPNNPNYVPPLGTIQDPEKPQSSTNPNENQQYPNSEPINNQNTTDAPNATTNPNNQTNYNSTNTRQNSVISTLNLAIYEDGSGAKTCSNITWGVLQPGEEATRTIYVKNTGNTAANLSLSASHWVPANAGDKLKVTWDKEGTKLDSGSLTVATLKLTVAENTGDLTDFNMNIVVSGST